MASSQQRAWVISARSCMLMPATQKPRCSRRSTRPSDTRRFSASRNGMALGVWRSARASMASLLPGSNLPPSRVQALPALKLDLACPFAPFG